MITSLKTKPMASGLRPEATPVDTGLTTTLNIHTYSGSAMPARQSTMQMSQVYPPLS